MNDEFVITGLGVVSAVGIGVASFWDAMLKRSSGTRPSSLPFVRIGAPRTAAIEDIAPHLDDRRFRRAANISKYALVAVNQAIADAGIVPAAWKGEEVGVVVGVTHGAINLTREFHSGFVKDGALGASPALFSESVLNAPAGNISIALGIKGAAHTVVGDSGAGLNAVEFGLKIMRNLKLPVCIIAGAEELDPIVARVYKGFGLLSSDGIRPFGLPSSGFVPGEGAGAIIIETRAHALSRSARIYAGIKALLSPIWPASPFSKEGLSGLDADAFVSTGANGTQRDAFEAALLSGIFSSPDAKMKKTYLGNIKPLIGESFAASALMQVVHAALVLNKGIIPPSTIAASAFMPSVAWATMNEAAEQRPVAQALVTSAGLKGPAHSILLTAPGDAHA
ncbi:MAG: beta-ketoacyl synthase N-terminal-like domain-containing protein [Deltaproteobacteria bacterium]